MDGPRPNPVEGWNRNKRGGETARETIPMFCQAVRSKNVGRKVEGQFQVSRLINQWYRGSYTVAFLAGNHWKQIWDSVLFRSKDQEVLIRQECMFLHQPKTRRFQLEN